MLRGSVLIGQTKQSSVDFYDADGVIVGRMPIGEGTVRGFDVLSAMPLGCGYKLNGVLVAGGSNRSVQADFGDLQFQSSANPNYKPSSTDQFARMIDQKLRRAAALAERADRTLQAALRARERGLGNDKLPRPPELLVDQRDPEQLEDGSGASEG